MSILFSGILGGYSGNLTTNQGPGFNADNAGALDIQFFETDSLLVSNNIDIVAPETVVTINGIQATTFSVEEWGILDGTTTQYILILADGEYYIITHLDGVFDPNSPIVQGNQNTRDLTPVCFVAGTLISTDSGDMRVENLCVGDSIATLGNGVQTISWVGRRKIADNHNPAHTPIRIKANALSEGLPKRDLLVSPQHRILVGGWRAEIMFGAPEVLIAAKHLVNDTDIRVATDLEEFEYYHIMFDAHQTVFSEGLPTESFHPGDMAMKSLSEASRTEILELFPELAAEVTGYGPSTHRSLKAFEAKALQSA